MAACALALVTALGLPSVASADDRASAANQVRSPFYGDVLYEFFQGHYYTALTGLMVSQQMSRLAPHEQEAELLRGGLLLSHGLQGEAGEVFARLTGANMEPAVRRRAWFLLAKVRYQRGLSAEAAVALEQIDGKLPAAQEDARALLQSQVYLELNRYDKAAEGLRALAARKAEAAAPAAPEASSDGFLNRMLSWVGWGSQPSASARPSEIDPEIAGRYARYNLGVALIRSGDAEGGARWLDELGQAATYNEEGRSLRDQANVTLGFSSLQAQKPEKARFYLERVRLNGPLSNKALLGFGWAAIALKQPKEALVPWVELAERPSDDAAVLEAKMAVPYALAESGETVSALQQYEAALKQFEAENSRLQESILALRKGEWLSEALSQSRSEELGVAALDAKTPSMPYAGHLRAVMAQNAVQQALTDYRDLQVVQDKLRSWQARLQAGLEATALRKADLETRLPALQATLTNRQDARSASLAQRVTAIVQANAVQAERVAALAPRTTAARDRLLALNTQVDILLRERQQYLQDLAAASLAQQQQRLAGYTTQARFALAQLYDRAYKENANPGVPRATSP